MTREIGRFEINCWVSRHAEKWARFQFGVTKKLPRAELNYFFRLCAKAHSNFQLNYLRKVTRAHPKMMSKLEMAEGRWGRGGVKISFYGFIYRLMVVSSGVIYLNFLCSPEIADVIFQRPRGSVKELNYFRGLLGKDEGEKKEKRKILGEKVGKKSAGGGGVRREE